MGKLRSSTIKWIEITGYGLGVKIDTKLIWRVIYSEQLETILKWTFPSKNVLWHQKGFRTWALTDHATLGLCSKLDFIGFDLSWAGEMKALKITSDGNCLNNLPCLHLLRRPIDHLHCVTCIFRRTLVFVLLWCSRWRVTWSLHLLTNPWT